MTMTYEDERHCGHCDKDTNHICRDSGHERDSSQDYQECLACGWWNLAVSDEYHEPIKPDINNAKVLAHLGTMLEIDKELYEKIMDTQGFAYHFNQICLLAVSDQ